MCYDVINFKKVQKRSHLRRYRMIHIRLPKNLMHTFHKIMRLGDPILYKAQHESQSVPFHFWHNKAHSSALNTVLSQRRLIEAQKMHTAPAGTTMSIAHLPRTIIVHPVSKILQLFREDMDSRRGCISCSKVQPSLQFKMGCTTQTVLHSLSQLNKLTLA